MSLLVLCGRAVLGLFRSPNLLYFPLGLKENSISYKEPFNSILGKSLQKTFILNMASMQQLYKCVTCDTSRMPIGR